MGEKCVVRERTKGKNRLKRSKEEGREGEWKQGGGREGN